MSKTTAKEERLYVRVHSDIKRDFEVLAKYNGLNPSAMLHSLIVRTIREAREEKPSIFDKPKTLTLDEAAMDDEQKRN
ncbi:MAG: hypothetical protein LUM44_10020 [Pyrinomonadaceae bacterium]|nr:hypothetical protein [Pyrinomonadaceae bacterium]